MKFWLAIIVMFSLGFASIINVTHAGTDINHFGHSFSNVETQDDLQHVPQKDKPTSSTIENAFCEMACHAGVALSAVTTSPIEKERVVDHGIVPFAQRLFTAEAPATPDQPPRFS